MIDHGGPRQFGMLAKYWQPGKVKTRLAQDIGASNASQLYRHFVALLVERMMGVADGHTLVYSPAERRHEFSLLAPNGWRLTPQAGGDLGNRMRSFFKDAFQAGAQRVVVIGSDSPTLPRAYIADAFALLDRHEVVLGPTRDGGYYLVAAREDVPHMFHGIDWSTERVWKQTLSRLTDASIVPATLAPWYDVDGVCDLKQLLSDLTTAPPSLARSSAARAQLVELRELLSSLAGSWKGDAV